MWALGSAWTGLIVGVLALVMLAWRPAFNDVTLPIALYGSVLAIGCGGIVLMRKDQPGDLPEGLTAQKLQAKIGIGLGMLAVIVSYALMSMGRPVGKG